VVQPRVDQNVHSSGRGNGLALEQRRSRHSERAFEDEFEAMFQ